MNHNAVKRLFANLLVGCLFIVAGFAVMIYMPSITFRVTNEAELWSAMTNAKKGVTIHLAQGTYSFDKEVIVDKSIRFIGAGSKDTIKAYHR